MVVGVSSTSPTRGAGRHACRPRRRRPAPCRPPRRSPTSPAAPGNGSSRAMWRAASSGAHEREAVGVQPVGGDADEGVAGLDPRRAPKLGAAGDADGEAGEVEAVVVGEMAGVLGGLAAEQHALGAQAAFVDAGHDVGHLLRLELADHQVVEKEQRHGAAGRDVVDAHRHGVDADRAVDAHLARQHDLGAGAVGAGHEHRVFDRRHAHEAAEAADALEHQRMVDRLEAFLEQPHGFVAGGDVDAGILVGEVLVGGHDPPSFVFDPTPCALFYAPAMMPAARAAPETLTVEDVTFAAAPQRAAADDRHQHPARGSAGRGRAGPLLAARGEAAVRGKLAVGAAEAGRARRARPASAAPLRDRRALPLPGPRVRAGRGRRRDRRRARPARRLAAGRAATRAPATLSSRSTVRAILDDRPTAALGPARCRRRATVRCACATAVSSWRARRRPTAATHFRPGTGGAPPTS